MVIKSLKLGLGKTLKEKRLIFYMWAIEAFLALIFIIPIFFFLRKAFAHSLLAINLSRGVDLIWLSDLIYNYRNLTPWIAGLGLTMILMAIPLSLGFDGGIIGALSSDHIFRFTDFIKAASYYFFRLLKIFLLFLLSLFLILFPLSRILSSLFNLWTEKATSAWPVFWAGLIKLLLLMILYSLLRMFFDYTRLLMALEDNRKALRGVVRLAVLLSSRFFAAWAVFLLASLVSLALTFFFFLTLRFLPTSSLLAFWLSFILGQIYLWLRLAAKVFTFGSCYYFVRQRQAAFGSK